MKILHDPKSFTIVKEQERASQDKTSPISSALATLLSIYWIDNSVWCTFPELFYRCENLSNGIC